MARRVMRRGNDVLCRYSLLKRTKLHRNRQETNKTTTVSRAMIFLANIADIINIIVVF